MWHQRIHKQIFVFDLKANGETSKQINRAIKLCVIVNMFFECYIHYLISLISHNKIYTFLSRKKIILSLVVSFWLSFLGVMKSSTSMATTCIFHSQCQQNTLCIPLLERDSHRSWWARLFIFFTMMNMKLNKCWRPKLLHFSSRPYWYHYPRAHSTINNTQ